MSYQITSQPATEPITVAEAKTHLRVTFSDDDTYITALIKVARKYCEQYMNRVLITQTWRQNENSFSDGYIELKVAPVISVTSLKYYDTNNTQQTLSASNYQVDLLDEIAVIYDGITTSFPSITSDRINPIEVIYVCGYGGASDVPVDIIHAIKLMVSHLYENREGVNVGVALVMTIPMPDVVKILLNPYRINVFG